MLFLPDSGLVVPSISFELHKRLLAAAESHGLSLERRLEMTGVCASQMALTLLGGPNRFVGLKQKLHNQKYLQRVWLSLVWFFS